MGKKHPLLKKILLLLAGLLVMTLMALTTNLFGLIPPPPVPPYRTLGPNAPAADIVEYTDFQCPACRNASKTLRAVMARNPGRIRLTFRHYPLPMHALAVPAAMAAECAGEQGKFWEYADMLYDNQQQWSGSARAKDTFASYAKTIGLDERRFIECAESPGTRAAIIRDDLAAQYRRIDSTPTFFLNGRKLQAGTKALIEELTKMGLDIPPEAR